MSSLVPGYMTVSWTVSPPAVGVRATCGVEGRPAREVSGEGRKEYILKSARHIISTQWGEGRGGGRVYISL